MSKKRIDKATAIKSILSDLKKGIDKPAIFYKFLQNFTVTRQSVNTYYNEAVKLHQPYLEKIKEVEERTIEKVVSEIVTNNILSKLERQQILSDIASGKQKVWKQAVSKEGVVTLESYDPHKYIDLLNKMDGIYTSEIEADEDITEIKITRINGA